MKCDGFQQDEKKRKGQTGRVKLMEMWGIFLHRESMYENSIVLHNGVALLPRLPLLSDFLKYLIMMLLQRLASHSAGIETEGWENLMSTSSHRQSELQHASSNALITKERSACNVERSQPYCSSYCQKSFIKYRRTQIQELPRSM